MSRTRKDKPWWVQATEWEPLHRIGCDAPGWHTRRPWQRRPGGEACNLPAEPDVSSYQATPDFRRMTHCTWTPVWPWRGLAHWGGPPHWYRKHVYYDPDRARKRAECQEARKEYRATGDVDIIPGTGQHRHSAAWLWW